MTVVWKKPNATDDSGYTPEVNCDRLSGTDFFVGITMVTCEAVDRSGNKAVCNFKIMVTGKMITALDEETRCLRGMGPILK